MALIENDSKLLITDYGKNLLHLLDLDGNILKSFNPSNFLKRPTGVCIRNSDDLNEEKVYIGDDEHHKVFVFNTNFQLQFQFGNLILMHPRYMRINNEFDSSRLYISDWPTDEITIWNASNGIFIDKIDVDTPQRINFTENSLYVNNTVYDHEIINNKVIKINQGGNCLFEIDKESLEIKRRIIGNWFSPQLLNLKSNGNLQIVAYTYDKNLIPSKIRYLLNIDQNVKIITKVELNGLEDLCDLILVNNKMIVSNDNKLKIFEFKIDCFC
jgi:hypothetical protein